MNRKWIQQHEGYAWLATALWLAGVGLAFWWKGADYAPLAKLDLEDWSYVGTVVSAIMSPVAVLWVVRSFYVQKKELASAVKAAGEQAEALDAQRRRIDAQSDAAFEPILILSTSAGREDGAVGLHLKNHGAPILEVKSPYVSALISPTGGHVANARGEILPLLDREYTAVLWVSADASLTEAPREDRVFVLQFKRLDLEVEQHRYHYINAEQRVALLEISRVQI
jgi:hypothetical protein